MNPLHAEIENKGRHKGANKLPFVTRKKEALYLEGKRVGSIEERERLGTLDGIKYHEQEQLINVKLNPGEKGIVVKIFDDIDKVAEFLDVVDIEKLFEGNFDYLIEASKIDVDSFMELGYTSQEIEEKRIEAENAVNDELVQRWRKAVEATMENLLEHFVMILSKDNYRYKVLVPFPIRTAEKIRAVINGVGFVYVGPEETSNPVKFIKTHFGAIKNYSDVYGGNSIQKMFEFNFKD